MNRKKGKVHLSTDGIKKMLYFDAMDAIKGIDIDIKNDREVFVDGCIGVEEFTDEKVVFLGKGMRITVFGEKLELYTFSGSCVKASGIVRIVEIERDMK